MPSTEPSAEAVLAAFEDLLRKREEIHEFWFDPDAEVFWAGDEMGDTLLDALRKLVANGG
jgi:hypothetical protein